MAITSRKISYLSSARRDTSAVQIIPAERQEALQVKAEANRRAAFFEVMETAMTGLVLVGALLFAANLVRYAAPVCAARDIAVGCLYALASVGGLATFTLTVIGIIRRLAPAQHQG